MLPSDAPPVAGPGAPAERRARGRLDASELAEAAVLADVTVALCLLGFLLPFGTVFVAFAVVPMSALAARHRFRAVLAGGVAAAGASLLVAGTGLTANVAICVLLGGFVGAAVRRGWSRTRSVVVAATCLWPPLAAAAIAVLALLSQSRRLALEQITNSWRGLARTLHRLGADRIVHLGNTVVAWLVRWWPIAVAAALLIGVVLGVWVVHSLSAPTLRRIGRRQPAWRRVSDGRGAPRPVPVRLDHVSARYPGATRDALEGVSLTVDPGELVAVVGPNGSGKSTLTRVLAGWVPTSGRVERPGLVGLGRDGGTSLVFQRPETQVLGVRVRDDVVWGLPPGHPVDVAELLARVGLEGFAERETSTLSGGELQRLALAAALARRPALLLSDETTAMIDCAGRRQIVELLASVAQGGTAVVHVTHRPEEAARADRRFMLTDGQFDVPATPCAPVRRPAGPAPSDRCERPVIIELAGVGHVYGEGTPWEHRALSGIDLQLRRGDGVLVVGHNGSGKSTLAWVLAGLIAPSEGTATVHGQPLDRRVGAVALSFQHARLQLLRDTVRAEVRAASGADGRRADAALELVGLDPRAFGDRRIDELSGGQQRRVALAGLLAAEPEVLVLDEPFAGLDEPGRAALADVLARLRSEQGLTLVIVSHDTEGLDGVVDRTVELEAGRIVGARGAAGPTRHRRQRELHLFRVVPGDTPVHRLWAGTKLIGLLAIAVALSIQPGWPSVGVAAALLATGIAVARIPRGAAPRLPRWFLIGLAIGATLALLAGGSPVVHVGSIRIGLGALGEWARATSLAAVLLLSAALVSWTTPLASVAPALRRLGAPFARLRLPVEEWSVSLALAIRCLPLLVDETRTLVAARRLRPRTRRRRDREALDLLAAELVVALRRAGELGAAIAARGGLGAIADDAKRPGWRDAVALVVIAGVVVAILLA